MPGFNIGGGVGPSNTTEFLRAHRWQAVQLGPLVVDSKKLILKDLTLPKIDIDEESVPGTTIEYKFAARVKFDDVECTFYDTIGLYGQLVEWRGQVWKPDTGLQTASKYKYVSIFSQTIPSGFFGSVPINTFKLKNSWPKSISHSTLSYEDSSVKTVALTLSYDWFEFKSNI